MSLIPPDAPPQFGKGAQPIPPDPNDLIVSSALLQLAATGIDYSSPYRVPNRPPVTNQGNTPECVA